MNDDDISYLKTNMETMRINFHMSNTRVKQLKEKLTEHDDLLQKLMDRPVTESATIPSLPVSGNIDIN